MRARPLLFSTIRSFRPFGILLGLGLIFIQCSALADTVINGDQSYNATFFSAGTTTIGADAYGRLTITQNASYSNTGIGYVGSGTNGNGTVDIVIGAGSWTASSDIYIGFNGGTGVVNLANGGTLRAGGSGGAGNVYLAGTAGTTGVLNIGGANPASPQVAGNLAAATVVFGAGTGSLNFNHTDGNLIFSSVLSGAGTLNQNAGTTRLTGASAAFSGPVNVTGGVLLVDGSLGGSPVNVGSGGVLGGSGSIAGAVTVQDGGILSPGSGPGSLTVGALSLSAGSLLSFDLDTAGVVGSGVNDLLNVTGNLTLNGTLNITNAGGFGGGVYRLINYGGALTDGSLDIGLVPDGSLAGDFEIQTSINGQVNLINSANISLLFWDGGAGGNFENGQIDGGSGTWSATSMNWTDSTGSSNGAMNPRPGFAVFQATAGTVTVDNAAGQVGVTGMQFAVSGYTIQGGGIVINDPATSIRVGDGNASSNGYVGEIASNLTGSGGLVKNDYGKLVLSGVNTHSGGTQVNLGVLELKNGAALADAGAVTIADVAGANLLVTHSETIGSLAGGGTTGGSVTIASGQVLTTGNSSSSVFAGTISGTGGLTKSGSGVFTVSRANSYTGDTTVSQGTLRAGATNVFAASSAFSVGGVLDLNGFNQTIGSLAGSGLVSNSTGPARTLTTGGNNLSTEFSGVISNGTGGMGFAKTGNGTLKLSGTNTYTGGTSVTGGTLLVTGSLGTTNVGVSNSTLAGNGRIGGSVTLGTGGRLAPGDGIGTMTIDGNLFFNNATSAIDFQLAPGGIGNDMVQVGGNARLQGRVNVSGAVAPLTGVTRIINYAGERDDGGDVMEIGTVSGGLDGTDLSVQTSVIGQVNLVNTDGLNVIFWDGDGSGADDYEISGGSGTWDNSGNNWTDASGEINGSYAAQSFAVFQGPAGMVTAGAVTSGGIQFADTGYVINGGPITLSEPETTIRVGDGSLAGAGYTATISSDLAGTGAGLLKIDLGTLILTGNNTYTGATQVRAGKLVVNSSVAGSAFTVSNAATLAGSGQIGSLTVLAGGTVAPGQSPGVLSSGDFDLRTGGRLGAEINGLNAGTEYDQLAVTGTVDLAGSLSVILGFSPSEGDRFFLLLNDGSEAIDGVFSGAGFEEGGRFEQNGTMFEITYQADWTGTAAGSSFTGGNDVAIRVIPEPSALLLLLASSGALCVRRRRRH